MARERWETMTTWGEYSLVDTDIDGYDYECREPPPPDGDGWEPFASGFGPRRYRDPRGLRHGSPDGRPTQYIVWRRKVDR